MKHIAALAHHDLTDSLRNVTIIALFAVCVLLCIVFTSLGNGTKLSDTESTAFIMTTVYCIATAFTGGTILMFVTAEEFDRGVPLTLVESGVTVNELALAKVLSAAILTLVTELVSGIVVGLSLQQSTLLLLVSLPAMLYVLLLSLGCSLYSPDQAKSNLMSVPIAMIAVLPILGFMSEAIRTFVCILPTGAAAELIRLLSGSPTLVSPVVLAAIIAIWLALSFIFVLKAKRHCDEKMDRLLNRLDPTSGKPL